MNLNFRGSLKSIIYFFTITQTSLRRILSTPPFGLSLNASYLTLFKQPLIKNYFFNKNPSYNLGVCRILFYGLFLEKLWADRYRVELFYYSQLVPRELWTPVGVFNFYSKDFFFSLVQVHMISNILCVFLLFAMIGFMTRISAVICFFMALLLLGYPNNFGTVFDSDCLFLVTLFVLIFSNMGSTLSVDNLLKKNKNVSKENEKIQLCWNLWTVKFIITLTCLFYFTSVIQKIRLAGLDWFLSDHMAISFIHMEHPVGLYLSQFTTFAKIMAFTGFVIEALSFLPVIYPATIPLFLTLFSLFHIFVDVGFGHHFDKHFMVLFIFLFPWGDITPGLPGRFKGHFWASFYTLCKIKLGKKSTISVLIIALVSLFVLTMSIYAPYKIKSMYPFSTTTMYAWIDGEPVVREIIFVTDRDNRKRRLKKSEIRPLAKQRLFSKLRELEKHGKNGEDQIKKILRKIRKFQLEFNNRNGIWTLEFIRKMTLEKCYWKTSRIYISRPYDPDYCRIFVEEVFHQ